MAEDKTRVVFSFDKDALITLKTMQKHGRHETLAETVAEALKLYKAVQDGAAKGYTDIVLHDPDDDETIIPLRSFGR